MGAIACSAYPVPIPIYQRKGIPGVK